MVYVQPLEIQILKKVFLGNSSALDSLYLLSLWVLPTISVSQSLTTGFGTILYLQVMGNGFTCAHGKVTVQGLIFLMLQGGIFLP